MYAVYRNLSSFPKYRKNEKGSILIISFLLVLIISTFATAITQLTVHTSKQYVREKQHEKALFIADAGVNVAIHALINLFPGGTYTGESGTIGNGTFIVSVSTMTSDRFTITSTGVVTIGSYQDLRCVNIIFSTYTIQQSSVFSYTLGTNENLSLSNSVTVTGDIRTNGNISCINTSSITGNAYAGGDIILRNSAYIGGDAYAKEDIQIWQQSQITGIEEEYYTGEKTDTVSFPDISTDTYRESVTVESGPTWSGYLVGATQTEHLDGPFTIEGNMVNEGTLYMTGPFVIGGDLINNGTLVITGPCEIAGTFENSGTCDLTGPCSVDTNLDVTGILDLSGTIGSTGTLYVTGNIDVDYTTQNQEDYGIRGTGIICTEGEVYVAHDGAIIGNPDSPVAILTTNNNATSAIQMKNNAFLQDCVFYAPLGGIDVGNSTLATSESYRVAFLGKNVAVSNSLTITVPTVPLLDTNLHLPGSQIKGTPKIHLWEEVSI